MALTDTVVLPIAYLPPIDLYCYIAQAKKVLLEVKETFPKQTYRNRTTILTANGPLTLTIPVRKPYGNGTKTCDIVIDAKTDWNKIHWKAITTAYNKSPFFLYYKDEIREQYSNIPESLSEFNFTFTNLMNRLLKIKTSLELTSEYHRSYEVFIDKREYPKFSEWHDFKLKPYTQVFNDRFPFITNLSLLDLLFNEGPQTLLYLKTAVFEKSHNDGYSIRM